jgi:hypothetical protein
MAKLTVAARWRQQEDVPAAGNRHDDKMFYTIGSFKPLSFG